MTKSRVRAVYAVCGAVVLAVVLSLVMLSDGHQPSQVVYSTPTPSSLSLPAPKSPALPTAPSHVPSASLPPSSAAPSPGIDPCALVPATMFQRVAGNTTMFISVSLSSYRRGLHEQDRTCVFRLAGAAGVLVPQPGTEQLNDNLMLRDGSILYKDVAFSPLLPADLSQLPGVFGGVWVANDDAIRNHKVLALAFDVHLGADVLSVVVGASGQVDRGTLFAVATPAAQALLSREGVTTL